MLTLREATARDIGYLLSLRKATMQQYLFLAGMACTDEDHLSRVKHGYEHAKLIYISDQKVGMIKYRYSHKRRAIYVYQLQIHSDFQSRGHGSFVLNWLIAKAQEDALAIELSVIKQNPAFNFYLRFGFFIIGEARSEYLLHLPAKSKHLADMSTWLNEDAMRFDILSALQQIELKSGFLAAGFLRNLVWDRLHLKSELTSLNDVDVIYFDDNEQDERACLEYESLLGKLMPTVNWQVKNQARMHHRNGDRAYLHTVDAMRFWPEKETAVGVRLNNRNEFEYISGFGFDSLFDLKVSYNSARNMEVFESRVNSKCWPSNWPDLTIDTSILSNKA